MNWTRSLFWLIALVVFTQAIGATDAFAAHRVILGDTQGIPLAAKSDPQTVQHLNVLHQKAANNGTIRLIVGVRAAFAPEGSMDPDTVVRQRKEIHDMQSTVLDKVPSLKLKPKNIKRFSTIPFMAVKADPAELDQLTSLAEVTSVEEDKVSTPSLAESVPLIGGTTAWNSGYTGLGQTVAVLDTGVDKTHPFLANKVVSEACYSSNYTPDGASSMCPGGVTETTADGSAMPYAGNCVAPECDHGTHVAGIAAGNGNSFSGVAKDASLIAIQVFSRFDGSNNCPNSASTCVLAYDSDIILGLERVYALRDSYNIAAANMSIGGGRWYQSTCDSGNAAMKSAIDDLRSVGIATVVASGNNGYLDSLSSPACISSAVSVGATWDATGRYDYICKSYSTVDQVICFSNSSSWLSLLAPGGFITSSTPGGGYAEWEGTSMAAPHVTGAWAVLKEKSAGLSVSDDLTALSSTGIPVTDSRNGIVKPRIQIDAALDAIPSACHTSLSPASTTDGTDATVGNIDVTADSGCNWNATSNASWITVTAGSSGTGSGTVAYSVDANTNADSRTGTMSIAGLTFTVFQAGTVDTIPPSIPTGLTATAVSPSQIDLSWTASTDLVGVTGYKIYRSGQMIAQVNTTSYSDTGLASLTSYTYTVAACDAAANCSSQSTAASATTLDSRVRDLVLTDLGTDTTAQAPGGIVKVSNTVLNQGDGPAGSFTIAFHLSVNTVYGDGDDIVLSATRSLSSLPAGRSSTATTAVTIPDTTPLGAYYICAMADSGNTVDEGANENNNTRCTAATVAATYPDLVVTDVTPADTVVNQGGDLTVSATVLNQGLLASGSSRLGFHLSTNNVYGDGDDVAINASISVTALDAGASSTISTKLSISSTTPPGTYYLCGQADTASRVVETDEGNNALCSATQVTVPPPDLVLTTFSTDATAVAPGDNIKVSNTITNQGGSKAGSFTTAFRLSSNQVYGDGDDIVLTATRSLIALTIGSSSSATTAVTIPDATPLGDYYICAMVDSGNTVDEGAYENNNTRCTAAPVAVTYADLVVTDITPADTVVNQGADLTVSATVLNQGLLASGSSRLGFHLSPNNVYGDGDDVAINASISVTALDAGASSTISTNLSISSTTPPGTYYLCGQADTTSSVVETDEGNNALCSATQVTVPPPDLVLTTFSTDATAVAPGGNVKVSNTITNQGGSKAGSFTTAFRLSSNQVYGDGDDIVLTATRSLLALTIGSSSSASTTVAIPDATPLGDYYICAMADSGNTVDEGAYENNNTRCTAAPVAVTYADLVVTDITPADTVVNQGGDLTLSATVLNQGLLASGSSRVSFSLSPNNVYGDGDDVAITAGLSMTALDGGASGTATTTIKVSSTTPPDTYYLCAQADSSDGVVETDEGNNALCSAIRVTVPPPDLVLTDLSLDATAAAPGDNIKVSNTITNQGGSKAGTFTTAFRLSSNQVYGDGDDIVLTATRSLNALAIGSSSTASTTVGIPDTTPLGDYYICAMTDSGNTVNEGAYENNNTRCTAAPVAVTYADLVLTDVTPADTAVNQGGDLTLSATVLNQGLLASRSSRVNFSLSLNNVYGDGDDVAITASLSMTALDGGASGTATTTVTVPSTTPPATYYLCATADSSDLVVETDEANNTLCSAIQVTVPPPDLVLTDLSLDAAAAAPGDNIKVSNTITNQGGSKAGSFTTAFRLSSNQVYGDGDDIVLTATRSLIALGIGSSSTASTTVGIPDTTPLGDYYICAMTDSGNTVDEGSNENNNTRCTATTVAVTYPDLVLTDVTPADTAVNQGGDLTVSATVLNQGLLASVSSRVNFSLSLNNVYGDGDDVAITAGLSMTALDAGASGTATTTVTVPSTIPPATYYLCATADSLDKVVETDESNNTFCSSVQVTVPPPDLVVSALSTSATTVSPGTRIYVDNDITNQGGSKAGSSTVAFHLSTNATYGDGDDIILANTRTILALAIDATNSRSTAMKIPSALSPGIYYICAKADDANTVAESNENNNTRCTSTTITVQ